MWGCYCRCAVYVSLCVCAYVFALCVRECLCVGVSVCLVYAGRLLLGIGDPAHNRTVRVAGIVADVPARSQLALSRACFVWKVCR